jgi:hypothetical protein
MRSYRLEQGTVLSVLAMYETRRLKIRALLLAAGELP